MRKHLHLALLPGFLTLCFSCSKPNNNPPDPYSQIPLNIEGTQLTGWKQLGNDPLYPTQFSDSFLYIFNIDSSSKTVEIYERNRRKTSYIRHDNAWKISQLQLASEGFPICLLEVQRNAGGTPTAVNQNCIVGASNTVTLSKLGDTTRFDLTDNSSALGSSWTFGYDDKARLLKDTYRSDGRQFPSLPIQESSTSVSYGADGLPQKITHLSASTENPDKKYQLKYKFEDTYTWQGAVNLTGLASFEKLLKKPDLPFLPRMTYFLPSLGVEVGWENINKLPTQMTRVTTYYAKGIDSATTTQQFVYSHQLNSSGQLSTLTRTNLTEKSAIKVQLYYK